jgi:quercetin dioxygenase-like cupin family protein
MPHVIVLLLVAASFGCASTRSMTGVHGTVLAKGTAPAGLGPVAAGPTDVTMRTITIPPGGTTGWHYHDGDLIAVVQSGTLTRTLADCSTVTTTAGASIFEPAGSAHVHVGTNRGTESVVLYVTYVLPAGSPLAHDAAPPACEEPRR